MKYLFPLVAVIVLARIAWVGSTIPGMQNVFGIDVPYAALILFICGFCWRVIYWAKSPVPFKIPTTCGQGYSLSWIKRDKLEAPVNTTEVVGRMFMEIVFFRSLWRNTKANIQPGPVLTYKSTRWLWFFGILFHYSMLIIVLRHLRLFVEPVPFLIDALGALDGLTFNPTPELSVYITDVLILCGLVALLLRRFLLRPVRYISLANDYFPLFLLIGIAISGISMRYFLRSGVDIIAIKKLAVGLATFNPEITTNIAPIFYTHLFLVSCLLAYFPFSKLMHMGGVFMSPTRDMANNSRMKRHINPWNPDIKPHSYASYEDEFREDMVEQGLPVEKELEKAED
ncbi:MAG: sulfate reduction electron transfer complex DsrMKJOP subunit DsrM [Candidatus Electrothrix aestuarii]|uniref:Sulfate reduction electron transfer complex DsrMKJOP subunit DsrM n=1 Tax=Candidatus Electrothrix aestuarii TaxID=3062594 RepID=A0AAU8LY83_9BACT|nr:sulfate reduction electron transfer complex DsrMKJOP subunit DsrM [Candidatus Electrothrix aestuarii]WPD22814.1 MAG: sulfate reduction electron transfer complex DsrMKJOP subunit DsrM [Candidatus Electrothrix sp. GW3-3]